jgi:hypothetical protein
MTGLVLLLALGRVYCTYVSGLSLRVNEAEYELGR